MVTFLLVFSKQLVYRVLLVAQHVGDIDIGVLFQADVHKSAGDARQHVLDGGLINVAHYVAGAAALPEQFGQLAVLHYRYPGLLERRVSENFSFNFCVCHKFSS